MTIQIFDFIYEYIWWILLGSYIVLMLKEYISDLNKSRRIHNERYNKLYMILDKYIKLSDDYNKLCEKVAKSKVKTIFENSIFSDFTFDKEKLYSDTIAKVIDEEENENIKAYIEIEYNRLKSLIH